MGTDACVTLDHRVRADDTTRADVDMRADDRIRADFNISRDTRSHINDGSRMYAGSHVTICFIWLFLNIPFGAQQLRLGHQLAFHLGLRVVAPQAAFVFIQCDM